jgi:site-specific DNA recombinase
MFRLDPPLHPRRGRTIRVIGVCRISTEHQDTKSLADQEALYREWLERNIEGKYELQVIAGKGSGESLEREEYQRVLEAVMSRQYDLVLTEDLGRICRRVDAHKLCEHAIDAETRVIAINDHVDTAREGWEVNSIFAVLRHESYNRDTSHRIRRSHRNRFQQGGVVQTLPYGYIKPHAHATDADCQKDPTAEPVYEEWFTRLEAGQSFSEIADWLNATRVPTGPHCRIREWSCRMVARVTRNPLLKGERRRNERVTKRVNQTCKRKSVKAGPNELLRRNCPHLAFIDPERYDRVLRRLAARNEKYRRKGEQGCDQRVGVPRKRTRWPGQHAQCGVCGRLFVYGGHGQRDHLMCDGVRDYKCWNSFTFDGPSAAQKLADAVRQEIEALEDLDDPMRQVVAEEAARMKSGSAVRCEELRTQIESLNHQQGNLARAIAKCSDSDALLGELQSVEFNLASMKDELAEVTRRNQQSAIVLPDAGELRQLGRETFADLACDSQDFGRLMRELIPEIYLYPYRLLDGGASVLRAHLRLNVANILPPLSRRGSELTCLSRRLVVDLFDPPQREEFRVPVVRLLRDESLSIKAAAERLGITATAAQRSLRLHSLVERRGLTDAYFPVIRPQESGTKLRRHQHRRYRFEPLPGHERPLFQPAD